MGHNHTHEISNQNEKKTRTVIIFTVITMFVEIIFGYITNSMSLLADGYHMGTHALALGLTYTAYVLIRKFKDSPKFPNGTSKIGTLTAYTSSIFLGLTGIWIIIEAIERLIHPLKIDFNDAILVAIIGLIVNAVCIYIMEGSPKGRKCEHENDDCKSEDYNFKAAYYHILADILTSILAIAALITGKFFNIIYFDAFVGILGGVLIIRWATSLLTKTIQVLIDMKTD